MSYEKSIFILVAWMALLETLRFARWLFREKGE